MENNEKIEPAGDKNEDELNQEKKMKRLDFLLDKATFLIVVFCLGLVFFLVFGDELYWKLCLALALFFMTVKELLKFMKRRVERV
jgi:hypothetical protein